MKTAEGWTLVEGMKLVPYKSTWKATAKLVDSFGEDELGAYVILTDAAGCNPRRVEFAEIGRRYKPAVL